MSYLYNKSEYNFTVFSLCQYNIGVVFSMLYLYLHPSDMLTVVLSMEITFPLNSSLILSFVTYSPLGVIGSEIT